MSENKGYLRPLTENGYDIFRPSSQAYCYRYEGYLETVGHDNISDSDFIALLENQLASMPYNSAKQLLWENHPTISGATYFGILQKSENGKYASLMRWGYGDGITIRRKINGEWQETQFLPTSQNLLTTYCAKIATMNFSFNDTQKGGSGWKTFRTGYLCKLISIHGEVGSNFLQREFKRIGIIDSENVPYTISESVGNLLLSDENGNANILQGFSSVSDGENFLATVQNSTNSLGGYTIKRSATVTKYSGYTIGFNRQYWYDREIVATQADINFLTSGKDFPYNENTYISNNQKLLKKGQLGDLILV